MFRRSRYSIGYLVDFDEINALDGEELVALIRDFTAFAQGVWRMWGVNEPEWDDFISVLNKHGVHLSFAHSDDWTKKKPFVNDRSLLSRFRICAGVRHLDAGTRPLSVNYYELIVELIIFLGLEDVMY